MKANRKMMFRRKLVYVAVASCFTVMPVFANPIGATVVNGQVGFATQGSTLTVTNSPNAIINWQQFSINTGEATRFVQQSAQSAVLNRVVGQDPSQLLGSLLSNGRVYLINPNGILFGQGAVIDVGGLVASTLKLTDGDFLARRLNFTDGVGAGGINNQGSITTPAGGNVYLIAPDITNSGVITSPQGEIMLAVGHTVNLMDTSNPNVQVTVGAPDTQAVNIGSLIARSGKVGIYGALIDQQGMVDANTAVAGANGKITLKASKDITLEPGSVTTASGMAGGVKDGGEIRIVADGKLNVKSGSAIHMNGGVDGGNGGFLELSGKQNIALNGAYTGAAKVAGYHGGTLLLDPTNIVICSTLLACGTGATSPTALGTGGIVLSGDAPTTGTLYLLPNMSGGGWTNVALAATNDISVKSTLVTGDVPVGGSLTLTAGNNITISAQIGLPSTAGRFNHDLTLTAGNNVNVNSSIYMSNNLLTLAANALGAGASGDVIIRQATANTLGNMNVSGRDFLAGEHRVYGNDTNIHAGGVLSIGSPTIAMRDVNIFGGIASEGPPANASVTAGSININAHSLALEGGSASCCGNNSANAELIANQDINITLTGGLTVKGGTVSWNNSAYALIRAGRNATILADGAITLTGGTINSGNNGNVSARMEASPYTIYVTFPNLTSGGYFVNGVEGGPLVPTSTGSSLTDSGFFTGGTPAVLNSTMFVTYLGSVLTNPVLRAVDFGANTTDVSPPFYVFFEPIRFGNNEDNKNDKPVCN